MPSLKASNIKYNNCECLGSFLRSENISCQPKRYNRDQQHFDFSAVSMKSTTSTQPQNVFSIHISERRRLLFFPSFLSLPFHCCPITLYVHFSFSQTKTNFFFSSWSQYCFFFHAFTLLSYVCGKDHQTYQTHRQKDKWNSVRLTLTHSLTLPFRLLFSFYTSIMKYEGNLNENSFSKFNIFEWGRVGVGDFLQCYMRLLHSFFFFFSK